MRSFIAFALTIVTQMAFAQKYTPSILANFEVIKSQSNFEAFYTAKLQKKLRVVALESSYSQIFERVLTDLVTNEGQVSYFLPELIFLPADSEATLLSSLAQISQLKPDVVILSQNFPAAHPQLTEALERTISSSAIWVVSAQSAARNLRSVATVDVVDSFPADQLVYGKPELLTRSQFEYTDGRWTRDSFNSTLIVAAGAVLFKSVYPQAGTRDFVAQTSLNTWGRAGLPLQLLGFLPTGPGCFYEVNFPQLPQHLQQLVNRGIVFVQTNRGARLMSAYDPLGLNPHLQRAALNDMFVWTPEGGKLFSRSATAGLPNTWVEVFQRPAEAGLCSQPLNNTGKLFQLPW
ncbi:MAG: hypothetical protein LW875_10200 [Proteobacteria bacterium]|jgi:hypothetical protein|nr:hypothetical protein [Pseudomonadota bacterium]